MFIYPLPKNEGFITLFGQFQLENQCYIFTSLKEYTENIKEKNKEVLASPYLILLYYTEFQKTKGFIY